MNVANFERIRYIGGSENDEATGVFVDSQNRIFVVGNTESPTFPIKNSTRPANPGADTFVSVFNFDLGDIGNIQT